MTGSAAMFPLRGSWFTLDDGLHRSFTGCPDRPRMATALAGMRRQAEESGATVWREDTGYTKPGAVIRLGLDLDRDSPRRFADAPRPCWHLSISDQGGGAATAVSDVELLGWVMAGWPAATDVAVYTLATGAGRHADIPIEGRKRGRQAAGRARRHRPHARRG